MKLFVVAVCIALTSPVGADGPPPIDDAPDQSDIKPVKKKKKTAKKKRRRVHAPTFDVSETLAWKYGQLTAAECEAEIKSRGLPFTIEATHGVLAGGRLTGPIKGVTFRSRLSEEQRATSPWEVLDCRLALALDDFADVLVAHDIVEVRHYSMHRVPPKSWPPGKVGSQHFGGMAIDAAIFITKDGTKMDVNDDWFGRIGAKTCGPDAKPRRKTDASLALRAILCETAAKRIFNVILTPNHNRAHRNHFHLDITAGAKWFVIDLKPRAVIFDLDGTLVDSLEDIAAALDLALDDHGVTRPTRAHVRSWIGGGARNLIVQAVGEPRADSILDRFRVHYSAQPVVHTKLYAGLDAILDQLATDGIKLAVLSNKPDPLTKRICEVLLARWSFAPVFGQRPHVALKPSPDAALEVAAALDVPPAQCAFVGDSAIDILTAQAANMIPIAVSWGFRPRVELAAAGPALIADAPADLAVLTSSGSRAS